MMWEAHPLTTLKASMACTGITLPLPNQSTAGCSHNILSLHTFTPNFILAFRREKSKQAILAFCILFGIAENQNSLCVHIQVLVSTFHVTKLLSLLQITTEPSTLILLKIFFLSGTTRNKRNSPNLPYVSSPQPTALPPASQS
jgi:hypothetical protein